jgi:hypothetical protein
MDEIYADYLCKLPYNWVPVDDGIKIDIRYTLECIDEQLRYEASQRLNLTSRESLYKNTPAKKLLFEEDDNG